MPEFRSTEPTLNDLLEALDRLAESEFHEIELRLGEARLRVSRGPTTGVAAAAPSVTSPVAPPSSALEIVPEPAPAASEEGLTEVTSPMVGTFYRRPRPDAEAFVSVGDRVERGQVLCIIEAMKLMNNIEADCAGEVISIEPKDGAAVQFGDRLFVIRDA